MTILYITLSAIVSGVIVFLFLRPRLNERQEINENIIKQNQEAELKQAQLKAENADLIDKHDILNQELQALSSEENNVKRNVDILNIKREEIKKSISDLETQARESADIFYKTNMERIENSLDQSLEKISNKYQQAQDDYQQTYLSLLEDLTNSIGARQLEIAKLNEQFNEAKQKVDATVEASRREEEKRTNLNFYIIQLSEQDIIEIEELREVRKKLRNPEALDKVIWKCYYEKPTGDLIGRVVGAEARIGIYKITNLTNNMCYIGQTNNFATRWKQHIKRGLGAEAATKNKLYPAMKEFGVENFSFEIVEDCTLAQLDEREQFWQDYFHAKDYGYSIK